MIQHFIVSLVESMSLKSQNILKGPIFCKIPSNNIFFNNMCLYPVNEPPRNNKSLSFTYVACSTF